MIRTATSPRFRLVEDKRSASMEGTAVVRRFRLARIRVDSRSPATPGVPPAKRL
jgi:hypothetical protein